MKNNEQNSYMKNNEQNSYMKIIEPSDRENILLHRQKPLHKLFD